MRVNLVLLSALLILPLVAAIGVGQLPLGSERSVKEKQPKSDKAPPNEDERIRNGIERAFKPVETERARLLKELLKRYPQAQEGLQAAPSGTAEFGRWFDLLASGQPVWRYGEVSHKSLREIFERIAGRMGLTTGEITRDQFLRYAQQYLGEGTSPSWKPPEESGPLAEAIKTFRGLDRNGDGQLNTDEMSERLRAEWNRHDANRDGAIDLPEYLAYFQARMEQVVAQQTGPASSGDRTPPATSIAEDDRKPAMWRAGKLPPGLPPWFTQLDADGDAQIGLYEWRQVGWSIPQFRQLDRNDDGFFTIQELMFHQAQVEQAARVPSDHPQAAGGSDPTSIANGYDLAPRSNKQSKEPRSNESNGAPRERKPKKPSTKG